METAQGWAASPVVSKPSRGNVATLPLYVDLTGMPGGALETKEVVAAWSARSATCRWRKKCCRTSWYVAFTCKFFPPCVFKYTWTSRLGRCTQECSVNSRRPSDVESCSEHNSRYVNDPFEFIQMTYNATKLFVIYGIVSPTGPDFMAGRAARRGL